MLSEKEKQLLLKDLCVRLPYNVVIRCTDNDTDYKCFLTTDILNELLHNTEYYDYKPYLRPMSSMTEDEQRTLDSMCNGVEMVSRLSGLKMFDKAFDWLNAHHFDYHGLIPMGLALEAPEGMYNN